MRVWYIYIYIYIYIKPIYIVILSIIIIIISVCAHHSYVYIVDSLNVCTKDNGKDVIVIL